MRRLLSIITAFVISFIVLVTLNDYGITWDEPINMANGTKYVQWLLHPNLNIVYEIFSVNQKIDIHPPFARVITGFTQEIFTQRLHMLDSIAGYRVSEVIFVFLLVFFLTYIACEQLGLMIGIGVGIVFSFFPHVFFLSHIVTPDYPITTLWFITVMIFMYEIKLKRVSLYSGIILGFALLTKIHSLVLFFGMIFYWVCVYCSKYFSKSKHEDMSHLYIKLICLVLFSFLVYFICWPWLWIDPLEKLIEYFFVQYMHGFIPVYFFHSVYPNNPPWYYTPFMFFATMPILFFIFICVGMLYSIFRGKTWHKWMVFWMIYPILFFSLPFSPRYDGIRLFLPAYPFTALVGGIGVQALLTVSEHKWIKRCIGFAIFIGCIITFYQSIIVYHPYEQSYYNEIIGGIHGAEKKGLEIDYWGSSFVKVLPWINLQKGKILCVVPWDLFSNFYESSGKIEKDVVFVKDFDTCNYAVVLMRKGVFQWYPGVSKIVENNSPIYSIKFSDVSLINIYSIR